MKKRALKILRANWLSLKNINTLPDILKRYLLKQASLLLIVPGLIIFSLIVGKIPVQQFLAALIIEVLIFMYVLGIGLKLGSGDFKVIQGKIKAIEEVRGWSFFNWDNLDIIKKEILIETSGNGFYKCILSKKDLLHLKTGMPVKIFTSNIDVRDAIKVITRYYVISVDTILTPDVLKPFNN